ncbi:pitrilysin family protein [Kamptonema cortianum]|uniref:Pitrilysin family protein n=1 Tax=Geitlerinema calcuttense NRMC-F 0142 TaxID=2922238 RepID=A0ABT7M022_9CYAN|nr:pitrilysin family protein [Geitlerinema calcuttense]MDK3160146.1 pitrilysin family protein [Kamptonema cortianum]MDL5057604.1 pitrilysin family protein [Geitlerinema calcuttense NRMC-F 0142]
MSLSVTPSRQSYQVDRIELENGMVVLVVENFAADIISGRIFVKAGSRRESREKAGLANLVASVLTKGTERLSSLEIAEKVESVGASLGADAASDYFLVSLKTVSADFSDILGLAAELLRSPAFEPAQVELERRLALQAIRSQQEQPFALALEGLRQSMYQQHPYAYSGLGSLSTVSQLQVEDLQAFHSTYFRPDNIVISLSGRISTPDAIALIKETFGDWQPPATPLPASPVVTVPPISGVTISPQETQQAIVMLGYLAASVQSEDYAALKLLNTYLGNGLSSRLFVELREKRGLAYDVSSFYPTRSETSQFVLYMGTAPTNTTVALEGLQQEAERLCTTRLTPEALQASKNKLLGQYALGKQTNAQIAQVLGWYETIGLGIDFDTQFQVDVSNVTVPIAQAIAQKYFTNPYISLVGPAEVVNPFVEE